jgi:hypothetical protein
MASDDKIPFLIIRTLEAPVPHRTPIFVRTQTIQEAYTAAINQDPVFHPNVRLEAFVVSHATMAPALRLKELAKFYFDAAHGAEQDFEEVWDMYGADPDDA